MRSIGRPIASGSAAIAAYFELFPEAAKVDRSASVMQPRARRVPCRDGIIEIERLFGPSPQLEAGSLRDLDRDGPCWEVYMPRTVFDGASAYFDPARGDLLARWLVLEG